MKAIIEGKKIHNYRVEIDISDYSNGVSPEEQAEWLMSIQHDTDSLMAICEDNDTEGYSEHTAIIKVVK